MKYKELTNFYKSKKVLLTGSTGFKGSWMTHILLTLGAEVLGYALKPPTDPNLYTILNMEHQENFHQIYADIRDLEKLNLVFEKFRPEIVFHLAAQPIVRDSYRDPLTTYSTNVMGTVNILECVRTSSSVRSFLNITTDKVYKNFEWEYGYREDDPLDGFDPYSNSKSCSELVTHSYRNSFFSDDRIRISTARTGNVIGGGDFASDRIIPDSIRAIGDAIEYGSTYALINVRSPYSIRPYQHVIEPVFMYLTIGMKQYEDKKYSGYYNIGPDDCDCITTGELVSFFCDKWNENGSFPHVQWKNKVEMNAPHESNFLKLECSKIKNIFGWKPNWHIDKAVAETVQWFKVWIAGEDIGVEMNREIEEYIYLK